MILKLGELIIVLIATMGWIQPDNKDFHIGVEQLAHTQSQKPCNTQKIHKINRFFGNFFVLIKFMRERKPIAKSKPKSIHFQLV